MDFDANISKDAVPHITYIHNNDVPFWSNKTKS